MELRASKHKITILKLVLCNMMWDIIFRLWSHLESYFSLPFPGFVTWSRFLKIFCLQFDDMRNEENHRPYGLGEGIKEGCAHERLRVPASSSEESVML